MKNLSFQRLSLSTVGLAIGIGLIGLGLGARPICAASLGVFVGAAVWVYAVAAEPNRANIAGSAVYVSVLCALAGAPLLGALFGGALIIIILALYAYFSRVPEEGS